MKEGLAKPSRIYEERTILTNTGFMKEGLEPNQPGFMKEGLDPKHRIYEGRTRS